MRNFLCLSFVFIQFFSTSQKEYAKDIIEKLTSPEFHGRGYVEQGDLIAANFIKKETQKYDNVKPLFGNESFQNYLIDVNTFPENVVVKIEDRNLIPGKDFIISPNSGSAQGKYKIVRIESYDFVDKLKTVRLSDEVVLILDIPKPADKDSLRSYNSIIYKLANIAPVIKFNEGKFTWSVSNNSIRKPIIEMSSKSINQNDSIIYLDIINKKIDNYETQNVGFIIEGKKKSKKNEYIFFTGHYDHLGEMGRGVHFPGANDNASGVSMILSLMKHYSENPPKQNIVFLFFGAEEIGLLGSKYFVENSPIDLNKIKCLINLDIFGTGDEGVTVVNATEFPDEFKKLLKSNRRQRYIPQIKKRGKAANSDHYWFTEKGVPSFFIYTLGGVSYYHDILDRAETLPLTKFNDIHNLLIKFVKKMR